MLKGSTLKALDVRILRPLIQTRSAVEAISAATPTASTGPTSPSMISATSIVGTPRRSSWGTPCRTFTAWSPTSATTTSLCRT
ncbi:uncharacterized protein LOC108030055 isoform X5 [Drosophila biarmipes]|uniref:uncharacterized protein LOC108030055 isoform X5 n=1 Tax=Drosophila biarmipes TaxID=125945 RepID=UPI0007E6959D|nr:uncharacterized protein LOC108030055 isoform X5 [Drosophila biarmipes]